MYLILRALNSRLLRWTPRALDSDPLAATLFD
jgi:hypothetical protein